MSLFSKLLNAQNEIKAITRDVTNPYYKSKYFDINGVIAELRPILKNNNLIALQPLTELSGKPAIKTMIIDPETGEKIEETTPLIENLDPQKFGAVVTYFRRYALVSMFLLEAEDDDANSASLQVGKITTWSPKTYTVAQSGQAWQKPHDVAKKASNEVVARVGMNPDIDKNAVIGKALKTGDFTKEDMDSLSKSLGV